MRSAAVLALTLGVAFALPALAEDGCAEAPRAQWLPQEQIKSKAEELGYTVRSIGEDDGCIEVKGFDKAGAKVEIYFDPITGAVVKTKED
ncbi:MAG: PepSY domain-containing protein [Geminicoccaceae bacterium]